ncbi:hypothetical protein ACTYEO_03750 [Rhodophyticola sp. SM2404]
MPKTCAMWRAGFVLGFPNLGAGTAGSLGAKFTAHPFLLTR